MKPSSSPGGYGTGTGVGPPPPDDPPPSVSIPCWIDFWRTSARFTAEIADPSSSASAP